MSKSSMSGIPGVDTMTDSLEFVKNLWGGMKIPGMVVPTLSVDEINKQITDLKAVESWLLLNMNMLRGTIQALEVQSSTISALHSMSETMSSMVKPAAAVAPGKSEFTSPFSFTPPAAEKPAAPQAREEEAPEPEPAADAAGLVAPFANPAAWWNLLQDQFQQAVNTAMVPEPQAPVATKAAAPRKRKPASK
ncbi:MAG: PhaM family polyhydroxyalkanoate granule multifunctional regulatory protein [Pseudomonadota bacterium]